MTHNYKSLYLLSELSFDVWLSLPLKSAGNFGSSGREIQFSFEKWKKKFEFRVGKLNRASD